ncbi:solute carrier family 39 (zinc transporter), member 1/2/3 [Geosmithia morbida]|uniref:Solute carrier family 39 (Zinc transporter), member 1/2/3 n=1 Tax=Geosmithia morbida TaxID=1094350 RepID=A0A9P5D222_9HYPO|nr:solute carrier family 39 (zinc transporter), member 1/2/3 [Geosmithia morbida]KAF4120380.1 solute carrier family 39 (zinc transporter), member 1/2/3 [Geosmithia morbida]
MYPRQESVILSTLVTREEEEASCDGEATDDTRRGLRIASIFIIMAASAVGSMLPIFLANQGRIHVPKALFFVCKYVGTGVILATAWLHLLDPALEALGDECLADRLGEYPWALAIGLWTVLVMFFVELMAARGIDDRDDGDPDGFAVADPELDPSLDFVKKKSVSDEQTVRSGDDNVNVSLGLPGRDGDVSYPPGGQDHLAHRRDHVEGDAHPRLTGQLLSIFILEFGIIFHSVFIGLTLGTTDELVILLVVLVFHQMFEGLGLGSRLAVSPWPKGRKWLPYLLAAGFSLSTPVGIAAGVGARPKNLNSQKLVNGIFDSISAGILMYTGLVELLAHEFMFNPYMRKAPLKIQLFAFACVLFGMGVMATLANWA